MSKSIGDMDVDYAELVQRTSGRAVLKISGSGKKIGLRLDRLTAGYLFSYLTQFLKTEEAGVAQLRRDLTLENR
jgi:hypothetical protein